MHLTTAHTAADERDAAISWLNVKLWDGTAGLDPSDTTVVIVEVASPDRAWRLDLIGERIIDHPWVRPDRSTCTRVRAVLAQDVRGRLGLDQPGAPCLRDVPVASRAATVSETTAEIVEFDRSRRAGRSWQ